MTVFNNLAKFMVQNNVFSFFAGTVIGFASSNVIKSFKTNMVDFYLFKLFKLPDNNIIIFITSIFEFIFIIYILYIVYKNVFKTLIDKYQQKNELEQQWKDDLLLNIKNINNKL
jgi:large-conductance mechanosensitive channel